MRAISQLTNGISRAFQKLLRYSNGTTISTSFLPLTPVWPVSFCSDLNEMLLLLLLSAGKSSIVATTVKTVHLYSTAIKFQIPSNNYHYILLNYYYIDIFGIIYLCIVYFTLEMSK